MNSEKIEWSVKRSISSDEVSNNEEDSGESAKKRKRIEVITIDDSPAPKIKSSPQTTLSSPQQTLQTEKQKICSKETQTDLIVSPKRDSVASQTENLISPITHQSAATSLKNMSPNLSPNHCSKQVSKENSQKRANSSKELNDKNRAKARGRSAELAIQNREFHSRTALNCECISDPNNKMPVNSAGERFNAEHYIRNLYRKQLLDALTNGNVPQGASNPIATAQRIEARIFKQFKICNRDYRNHVTERSGFLNDSDYRELRLNVVMNRIKPEQYAFMSIDDMDHEKMVELRIATKIAERCASIRDL